MDMIYGMALLDRCTYDSCNPANGLCAFQPLPNCCQSDAECIDKNDLCRQGKCKNGKCEYKPKLCNDQNACTADSCDKATGQCRFEKKVCNDNDKCTVDSCDLFTGQCKFEPIKCDDGKK